MASLSRRGLIAGFGSAFASACCKREPSDAFFCANDPNFSDIRTPLTIDVHAHVFNGSDLQIEGFIKYVRLKNVPARGLIGAILRELGRDFAPSAHQELNELKAVELELQKCDRTALRRFVQSRRGDRYVTGQIELKAALARARQRNAFIVRTASDAEIALQIVRLPKTYEEYRMARRTPQLTAFELNVAGVIDFILRNFQYRYVNVHDYLEEYSRGNRRKVDLIVAHLVDYDWPIGQGEQTPTTLADQVTVMERITQLTGGRVHTYVPFDPFKHVAWKHGLASYDPLVFAKQAVHKHGCIGVKLYPPMGFAPMLNISLPAGYWQGSPLPQALKQLDLRSALDQSLGELYDWCITEDVPIMAHTGPSNLVMPAFAQLVSATYWSQLVNDGRHGGLRVNFGHFGDTDVVDNKAVHARDYAALMTPDPKSPGGRLFADSAYFADALASSPNALRTSLADLLRETSGKGDAALANRLMYGTDWEMVTVEGPASEDYLTHFESLFDQLSSDDSIHAPRNLADRFFGANAVNYLGLNQGDATRGRLESFYGAGRRPAWMDKVDNRSAQAALPR